MKGKIQNIEEGKIAVIGEAPPICPIPTSYPDTIAYTRLLLAVRASALQVTVLTGKWQASDQIHLRD